MRMDACSAERYCTSWKLKADQPNVERTGWPEITHDKAAKSSMELITASDSATVVQTLEKDMFFQSELGISAGLFPLTW